MIRDAQRGLLETIPSDLLYEEAPQADHIWESSRLFVAHDVPASQRRAVHARLILELGAAARNLGATELLLKRCGRKVADVRDHAADSQA